MSFQVWSNSELSKNLSIFSGSICAALFQSGFHSPEPSTHIQAGQEMEKQLFCFLLPTSPVLTSRCYRWQAHSHIIKVKDNTIDKFGMVFCA